MSSTHSIGQTVILTPLEALQKALPSEIVARPKLSLKENITTILADLEVYAQTTTALPDSNNLVSGWTAQNDRQLIETITTYKDALLPEANQRIQSFISTRMKRAFLDRPNDLWEHYFVVSKLYPEQTFWVSFYESLLAQPNINWASVRNQDWISSTLLPTITSMKPPATTAWNKELLLNLLSLLKHQWGRLISDSLASSGKVFMLTLESIDRFLEMSDSRLHTISSSDLNEIQKLFVEFLQTLSIEIPQSPLLSSLTPGPALRSLIIEAMVMNSFILSTQDHKTHLTLDSPRVKSFLALHDSATVWMAKANSDLNEAQKFRQAIATSFYLRTLISLKISLSNEANIISKGTWISDQQFQKGMELFWYEELLKTQTEAMRITQLTLYNLSLIDKCYRDNLQTPTCQSWRDSLPLHLKTITEQDGTKRKVWEITSKVPVTLPPGQIIFAPDEEVHIVAPEIRFHLLTRLSVPSGKVEIETNKLSYAWIDVSGSNSAAGVNSSGFPGQKPWIKNSQHCAPRDYLEGVTFMNIPLKQQVKWVGFSVKNPFPKNVLVCASHAQMENKDIVGDLKQVLDLGLPPESNEGVTPTAGTPGGQIKVDLTNTNNEKSVLAFPLLLAMGGDGSIGRDGQSSPLCHQGQYQSFKVALSHHKEWFQKWLNEQNAAAGLTLISKDQFGDHWFGLFEINLPRTSGTDGGNAGNGGQINIKAETPRPSRWFISPGVPGNGGRFGACGPNEVHEGKPGRPAQPGSLNILKKEK